MEAKERRSSLRVFFAESADLEGFHPAPADASRPGFGPNWALHTCCCGPGFSQPEETNSAKLTPTEIRSGRCQVKTAWYLFPEGFHG